MTESTPETTTPPATTPPATTPPATTPPATTPAAPPATDKRWAVYNTTLLRFEGGTHDRKPSKAQAEKLIPEGHKFELREV